MKKLIAWILPLFLLTGCSAENTTIETEEAQTSNGTDPAASAVPSGTAATEPAANVVTPSFNKALGVMGDVMRGTSLEFTLNSAYLTTDYQGVKADNGRQFVVCNVTVHNLQDTDLIFYDSDLQIQWGGEDDQDFAMPLTCRDEQWGIGNYYKFHANLDGVTGMFDTEQTMAADETKTADLVYQVPGGTSDFTMLFQEYFEDKSLGAVMVVGFTAEPENTQNQ